MVKINFSDYQLNKRTIKSVLKKINMENEFRDDNIYTQDKVDLICAYIIKNGTDNNKMSATFCITDLETKIEEEKKRQELIEKRKKMSVHKISNISYTISDYSNVEFTNEAIFEHPWTKEYEELTGYSLICKDLCGQYVIKTYKNIPHSKQLNIVQKILLMYSNIIRHMKEEGLLFEEIAERYHFKESLSFLPIIEKIILTERS